VQNTCTFVAFILLIYLFLREGEKVNYSCSNWTIIGYILLNKRNNNKKQNVSPRKKMILTAE